jgi:hypothetical protein
VTLRSRLRAVERRAEPLIRAPEVAPIGACDRIEQLTATVVEHPPVLSAAVEAGIMAAADREERWAVPAGAINPA